VRRVPRLWRLNVQASQIEECIRLSLFAIDQHPQNPPLEEGDYLLLQLVLADAHRLGKERSRIEFALVFERLEKDLDGSVSRRHWPKAGKAWRYIVHCSETVPTVPFSLENLGLEYNVAGQTNPKLIHPSDAALVWPWIRTPQEVEPRRRIPEDVLRRVIINWDRVVTEGPIRTTRVREHERRLLNPLIHDMLKLEYDCHCQVCRHDFKPVYGVPYAETRLLTPLERGGTAVSRNIVVLCPNHNGIIGAAGATFDPGQLAFRFPNGHIDKIVLDRHLAA
jgi:hypothetical protein